MKPTPFFLGPWEFTEPGRFRKTDSIGGNSAIYRKTKTVLEVPFPQSHNVAWRAVLTAIMALARPTMDFGYLEVEFF